MAASRFGGVPGAAQGAGQPPCRAGCGARSRKARAGRRAARLLAGAAGVPLLAGCLQGPLSALDPASAVTRSVAALWWTMAAGTGVILLLMVALAMIAVRRNPPRAPGRRGVRVMLVAGGLMLPGIVIAALLAFGLKLDEAQWPPGARAEADRAFHVDLIAHQWWWEVRYPGTPGAASSADAAQAGRADPGAGGGPPRPVVPADERPPAGGAAAASGAGPLRTVNVLHVPAGVPIHLRIMASDVIHGFWVPRIAGKLDAVPGRVNRIRLLVDEPGEYEGVCAEYCGDGHAHMRFTLVAHPPGELPRRLAELAEARP